MGVFQARVLDWGAIAFSNSAIKRNKFESVLVMWMNLEPVIQSEKNKYHILTHYIWNLENCTDESIYRAGRDTDIANRLVGTMG